MPVRRGGSFRQIRLRTHRSRQAGGQDRARKRRKRMARALFPLPDPGVRRIQPVFQILRRQRHRCLRDRKQPIHHRDESLFVRRGSGRHAQFRYEKLAHQLLRTPEKSRQHRIDLQGHGGRLQIHGDGDIRGNGRPARHHHGELLHPDPRFRGHRLVGRPGDLPE